MKASRLLATSLRALRAQRMRSALASASVAVGVAAVLVTDAIGRGAQSELRRSLASMGTNLLVIRPAQVPRRVARKEQRGLVTSLVLADHEAVSRLSRVTVSVPAASATARVRAESAFMDATVTGTTPAFLAVRSFQLARGRFIAAEDDREATRVVVLGARVAEQLFLGRDPTGETLRIRGVPFQVIGVFGAKGVLADGSDEDGVVVVPLRTALRRVLNVAWVDTVFVRVAHPELMRPVEAELGRLLRERHGLRDDQPDDFTIQDRARFLAAQEQTVAFLARLTTGLASLAALVGGTGILALMLLGVRERRGEIGLRVALGARPRDILLQFLSEAAALSLGGWAAGLVLAALAASAISLGTGWRVEASGTAAVVSVLATLITGVGFGSVPARKAALVPPIQGLACR